MNVDSPKAYTISDVDSMPAEMTTPLQLSPLRLVPSGRQAWTSRRMGRPLSAYAVSWSSESADSRGASPVCHCAT